MPYLDPDITDPEVLAAQQNHPGPCRRCGGDGVDPNVQPACCGQGNETGCCGDPIPDYQPCQDCHGTGNDYSHGDVPEDLWGMEDANAEGGFVYPCRVCGENFDIICEPHEFHPDHHYCGRDSVCCP